MQIEISKIPEDGARFTGEDPSAILELEQEPDLRVESPVRYDLRVNTVSNRVLVKGVIAVDMSFACWRCDTFFRQTVSEPAFECIREFQDPNESLDLTQDIREAMILSFPSHPVCRIDCRGLCPQCGANLNKGPCGCTARSSGGHWQALDNIRLQQEARHGCSKKKKIEK